ncbi:MAG: ribonuclease III [bacterium]
MGIDLEQQLVELELRLGYAFQSRGHLETAVTHKSYANEHTPQLPHNERMEFLGDAVVALVVGHLLMARHPEWSEGELSKARSALVSATGLAEVARSLDLGEALRLGRGEERTGGRSKPSILADGFEALSAALYLDGGYEVALEVLQRLFEARLDDALRGVKRMDPKTHLQERIQAVYKRAPEYDLVETNGPEHDLRFTVQLVVDGVALATGEGRTKKDAEQNAAAEILDRLSEGEQVQDLLGNNNTPESS